jgi:CRP/FNR family transcriptional regulator, cyclic AMP receptor protein
MQDTEAPSRRARERGHLGHTTGLSCEERRSLEHGRLFRRLPPALQDAIVGRAYVWRLKDGEQVLAQDGTPQHWIGVASGELLGRMRSLENGQTVATHVLAPGVWLNLYSPLCSVRERGIEFVASGPTCLLAVSRADLLDLCGRWPELVAAMLSLSALNLRFAHLMLQETQSNTLEQKLLRWLDSAVRFEYPERDPSGWVYRSVVPQSALASAAGVSRQSWNAGIARLEATGVIQRAKDGLKVPDLSRLEAALKQHGLHETAQYLQAEAHPVLPAAPLPSEARPISSLRGDEREALNAQRWYARSSGPLREALLSQMQVLRLPDKALIASADRQPPGWVALLQGGLRLISSPRAWPGNDGEPAGARRRLPPRAILAQLPCGTTFFEHALIDRGNCGVDVCSEGDSTLLLMSAEAFRAALAAHPEFSLSILKWLSFSHHQTGYLKLLLALPMPLRLHAWLDALARWRGQRDGDWVTLSMTLGQQEIAAWLSTTRQYVAKALNELEASGRLLRRRDAFQLRRDALPLARPAGPVRIVEDGAEPS